MADDSISRADDLETLARALFRDLSEAERRVLRAVPKGELAICGPNDNDKDQANNPAKADNPPEAGGWGSEREIRADFIRWLCVEQEPSKTVNPRGLRAYGAKITGKLDLSFTTVPFPVRLARCRLTAGADLEYLRIPALYLEGSSVEMLDFDQADIRGAVFLSNGFSSVGELRLAGARIGGDLVCNRGSFENPGAMALVAHGAEIKGNAFLRDGFSAQGEVNFVGAHIGGNLECGRGAFKNPVGKALNADGAEIRGYIFLTHALTEGEVNLLHAHVAGNLECDGGAFKNPAGKALFADGAEIKGSVFLRDGFSAEGETSLAAAQIEGALDCGEGRFSALQLYTASVKQNFVWRGIKGVEEVDLTDANVGVIWDDEPSWKIVGKLNLDGFVYGGFSTGPTDATMRLRWLESQAEFTPQPYRQLAKVLRELGDEEGAKQVLLELEQRTRAKDRSRFSRAPVRWLHFSEDTVSDVTVGYGIYPGRAVWCLGLLITLGWLLHRRAQRVGAIAPTDKDAYKEFHDNDGRAPQSYQPFNPLVYSLENSIPLVKFGQDDHWQPDPSPQWHVPTRPERGTIFGRAAVAANWLLDTLVPNWAISPVALRWIRWTMIGLGWLLATFFVAAVTGLIKTGQ